MKKPTFLKSFAAMPLQWIVACCFVLLGSQVSYAATCTTTPATSAPSDNWVLILAPTVVALDEGGAADLEGNPCDSLEASQARALGFDVEIDDEAAWGAKSTENFATYRAIVLGDANCPDETAGATADSPVAAAVDNRSTWGPAITGPVAVVGTDPVFHYIVSHGSLVQTAQLIQNSIAMAASVSGKPGAYICLSCYYEGVSSSTTVNVLQPFGTFTVKKGSAFSGGESGSDSAHILDVTSPLIIASDPALTDEGLSNWGFSVHEVFDSYPTSYTAVVESVENQLPYIVTNTGQPSETKPVNDDPETPTTFNFQGGPDGGGYAYTAQLDPGGGTVDVKVTPILKTQAECNALVNLNPAFLGAQCLVYDNADGLGGTAAVMFEVTCPQRTDNKCDGTESSSTFEAELGTQFTFQLANNPEFSKILPLPGWLKGEALDNAHPCTPNPDNTTPLFQSNQIESFVIVGDPKATTKGKSGGTGSCWVATYNTPHVAPSLTVTTPANNATYTQGANIPSNFTCTAVNTLPANPTSPVGPYLTVPETPAPGCTASVDSGAAITSGTPIATSATGTHTFIATVLDSGSDTQLSQTITYTVVAAAEISISPNAFDFGTVDLDKNPKQTFTVTNTGSVPVKFTKVAITAGTGPDARGFKTQNCGCSGTLNPGKKCTVVVVFNDDHAGLSTATLFFYDNVSGSPQGVSLSGNVINPRISLSPSALSFGTHKVNSTSSKTVVLKSTGTSTLTFNSITLGGSNAADFSTSGCTSSSLAAGTSCTLTVTFKPKAKGSRSASITITDNASNSPQKVTLTGAGN